MFLIYVFVIVYIDPTIASVEEKFTALHFSARYLPRVIDSAAQQQETEEQTQRVDKRSSSWRAVKYLINLRGDKKIEVKRELMDSFVLE